MFERIVVGVDGSETSDRAVRMACDLANKYNSAIYLVHTPQPQSVAFALGAMSGYHAVTTMPDPAAVAKAATVILDRARKVAADCGRQIAATRSDRGDPAAQIIACAADVGADLIVTGRRGLGSMGALVQGSTSQQIGHLANCATLSVH
ncbi:MAG: universal stress protein [Pseudomonadota bacterium]